MSEKTATPMESLVRSLRVLLISLVVALALTVAWTVLQTFQGGTRAFPHPDD